MTVTVDTMPKSREVVPVLITRRVPCPPAEVNACLSQDPARLFQTADEPASMADGRFPVPLHVSLAGAHFDRIAAVGFATVVEEEDGTRVLPLWWEAAEQPWLFPTFDGGLEIRSDDGGTQLRLEGNYRPPLGAAGALVNRAVLNKAATASLEALLDRLSARLTAAPADLSAVPGGAAR
jgi:hypothetical protein